MHQFYRNFHSYGASQQTNNKRVIILESFRTEIVQIQELIFHTTALILVTKLTVDLLNPDISSKQL